VPTPLVAFPGAYNANDPGLKIDVYYPIVSDVASNPLDNRRNKSIANWLFKPKSYTNPGPAVWKG
jgi:hypothetical protein